MDLHVYSDGRLTAGEEEFKCAIGKNGVVFPEEKKEGDGATPAGTYPLRKVYFRADKFFILDTDLPTEEIAEDSGWCDDPKDPKYNQPVKLPYKGRAEHLWREDDLYDIVVVIGFNDTSIEAGKGSAIFIHAAREDYAPTDGCVALSTDDLIHILPMLSSASKITIHP
jgi:L,D-peptidoglycan transpeptidase YkuD (ErfK/YbiS/YcfS/YnhG family)